MNTNRNSSPTTTKLNVTGMHCAACEVLIEEIIKENTPANNINASTSTGEVTIEHDSNFNLNLDQLNSELKSHGYSLSIGPGAKHDEPPLIRITDEKIYINLLKWKKIIQICAIVSILIYAFYWLQRSGIASQVMLTKDTQPTVYFVFGIIAGASTCAALVGGVLLSLSKSWNVQFKSKTSPLSSFIPHILFHTGRLLAFVIAGGVLAYLGASIENVVVAAGPIIAFGAGTVMVILGLQMLDAPWVKRIRIALPKKLSAFTRSDPHKPNPLSPFFIGIASVLLPCGMTLTAFITTIASGSFATGATNMLAFALGTTVMLSVISIISVGFSFSTTLSSKFNQVAGIIVVFFGLFTINAQLNATGLPSFSDLIDRVSPPLQSESSIAPMTNSQTIRMDASASGYSPTSFIIKSGVPVRWEINNTGASGCTNAIIAREFFDGNIVLNPGMNVIEFTPQKPGKYKFSCWMGMVGGTITVT